MRAEKVMLDTQVWVWYLVGSQRLKPEIRSAIESHRLKNTLYLSAISPWEVATKEAIGKLIFQTPIHTWMNAAIKEFGIQLVPLSPEISIESANLPEFEHRDPADRIIVASARVQNLTLCTADAILLKYGKSGAVKFLKACA